MRVRTTNGTVSATDVAWNQTNMTTESLNSTEAPVDVNLSNTTVDIVEQLHTSTIGSVVTATTTSGATSFSSVV